MDLFTFGKVFLFKNNNYVWLAFDPNEEKLHLAMIWDREKTKELIRLDNKEAKKPNSSPDNPLFAYVVLTTEDFKERAAHLIKSDEHIEKNDAENKDDFKPLGELNNEDLIGLKSRILEGRGVSGRLVKLVKNLDDNKQA